MSHTAAHSEGSAPSIRRGLNDILESGKFKLPKTNEVFYFFEKKKEKKIDKRKCIDTQYHKSVL